MQSLKWTSALFFLLSFSVHALERVYVDTTSLSNWTTVSKSDTIIGTVELYHEAFNKLEFTTDLIAEKTLSNVYLQQDSIAGWYTGKLGLNGHFIVLEQNSDNHSGEFVLYGTGKIKFFSARLLIHFHYREISDSLLYGTMSISVDKRFFLVKKLLNKEVQKTFRYMQVLGKNLFEDSRLQQMLMAERIVLNEREEL
jgi:hypothetical protein